MKVVESLVLVVVNVPDSVVVSVLVPLIVVDRRVVVGDVVVNVLVPEV